MIEDKQKNEIEQPDRATEKSRHLTWDELLAKATKYLMEKGIVNSPEDIRVTSV